MRFTTNPSRSARPHLNNHPRSDHRQAEILPLESRRLMSGDAMVALPAALPTVGTGDSHLFEPKMLDLGGEHGYLVNSVVDQFPSGAGPEQPSVLRYHRQDYAWGDFEVHDAMRANPGNLEDGSFGMADLHVSYGELYARDANGQFIQSHVDETRVRQVAREVSEKGVKWVIDIEHWPTDIRRDGEAAVRETMDKMLQIIEWAKDERSEVEIGFYGIMPLRDYWTPNMLDKRRNEWINAVNNNDSGWAEIYEGLYHEELADYQEWQHANDFLKPLAEAIDFIVPSLYTFYEDAHGWEIYATANLTEAARYGKPVLPFIWPQYHNSNPDVGLQHLPADEWRGQLDLTKKLADGVAIWRAGDPISDTHGWWQQTLAFIADLEQDEEPT